MKLRSHGDDASSSKEKAELKNVDGSDEDDCTEDPSSDSDCNVSSDEGEDPLDAFEVNIDRAAALGISDDDGVRKRRKKNSSGKGGGQSSKKALEEESEGFQSIFGIAPGGIIDFSRGIAEISDREKKDEKKKDRPTLMWEVLEHENERLIKEYLNVDMDLINQNEIEMETMEPSEDLIIPLLRYQKEWLAWALKQEESTARGGILTDDMGMGKTLQAIALVLFKRSISLGIPETHLPSSSSSSSKKLPPIKGTLVVCPLAAVMKWVREIDRSTSKGSTKVLVYHGANRAKKHHQFSQYDFVITTYTTIEAEFRKYVMPPKEMKNDCSIDGSDVPGLTSSKGKSILHFVAWERIVLDEARCIKDRFSNTARAVLALRSRYKWALSGTPIQNPGELHSLILFLRILPYAYYFCMDCDCRTLNYSIGECPRCNHKYIRHFCWWIKYISSPMQCNARKEGVRRAMILLEHRVLKSLMLRRTKEGRAADLALPPRIVTLRRDSLDVDEEAYYMALYIDSTEKFNTFVEAGTLRNNYAYMCDLLTRLHQALDHLYLLEYSITPKTIVKGFRPSSILHNIELDEFQTSTKIDALREEIRFMVERDGSAKAIVFSHFSSFLDLIHYSLQKSAVQCVQLDGHMSTGARDAAIKKFTDDPSCRIILMVFKEGVALNLTVASHVFLMDMWWNPAVERRAQDRIHRIGQFKPVRIVRFITVNTVEERILKLQEKKDAVFEGTPGCWEALARLTKADFRFLFLT